MKKIVFTLALLQAIMTLEAQRIEVSVDPNYLNDIRVQTSMDFFDTAEAFMAVESWRKTIVAVGYDFEIFTKGKLSARFGGEIGYGMDEFLHTAMHLKMEYAKDKYSYILNLRSCQNERNYTEARLGVCIYLHRSSGSYPVRKFQLGKR